jgi:CHAT domain-containing protein
MQAKTRPPRHQLSLLAYGDPDLGKYAGRVIFRNLDTTQSVIRDDSTQAALYQEQRGLTLGSLPHAATEVQNIAQFFPPDQVAIRLREQATEEQVKTAKLDEYAMLHFACHGFFDEKSPSHSCLVLALDDDPQEDGFLQMHEIFNLTLDADLVVLSACETGRGKLMSGEGSVGLTRAFFYAGVRSLVVSQWKVRDESTAELMTKFYGYMRAGKTKPDALRQARLELIRGDNATWRHPFYWAPFILTGYHK